MLVLYPLADRHKQPNSSLSHTKLQPIAYYFNNIIKSCTRKEIVRFHQFDYLIDFLQFQHRLLIIEIDGVSAVDDGVDGVFEINKQILLCILTQQHFLHHIMIQNASS